MPSADDDSGYLLIHAWRQALLTATETLVGLVITS